MTKQDLDTEVADIRQAVKDGHVPFDVGCDLISQAHRDYAEACLKANDTELEYHDY